MNILNTKELSKKIGRESDTPFKIRHLKYEVSHSQPHRGMTYQPRATPWV